LDFLASRPARWRFLPDSLTSRSTGSPLPEGPPSSSVRIGIFPQASPQRLISLLHTITCMCPPKAFSHVVISVLICLILPPTRAGISRSRLGQKRDRRPIPIGHGHIAHT
jgi:hypothetical protein